MDCSLSGSSVHGILQARILEWVAISLARGSSRSRDRTLVSCTAGRPASILPRAEGGAPSHLPSLCCCMERPYLPPAPGPQGRTCFFPSISPQYQGLISFTACLRHLSTAGTECGCCEIRLLHQDTFFLSPSADCHSAHRTGMIFTSLSREKVTITVIASTCCAGRPLTAAYLLRPRPPPARI